MLTKAQIRKSLKEFIEVSDKEFQVMAIWTFLKQKFKISELAEKEMHIAMDLINNELNHLIVSKTVPIPGKNTFAAEYYISRKSLFTGSKFLIKPTEYELTNNILIAGHRFTPFCSPALPTDKIKLFNTETRKYVPRNKVKVLFDDLIIYYTMLGLSYMLEELSVLDENFEKLSRLDNNNHELIVSALNMSEFYHRNSFKPGDYIIAEVKDFNKGICNIEYLPLKNLKNSAGSISNWYSKFERAVLKTVDEYEDSTYDLNIAKQLSEAFFIADKSLLETPVVHLGGFLAKSKKLEMVNVEKHTLYWEKNREFVPPEMSLLHEGMNNLMQEDDFFSNYADIPGKKKNNLRTLDNVLEYMGYNLSKEEIIAYMKDELHSGKKELNNVIARCYDNRDALYPDAAPKLYSLTNKVWEKTKKNYNIFSDNRVAKLRHKLLKLNDNNIGWQRKLDSAGGEIGLEDIPEEMLRAVTEMTPYLIDLMITFNEPDKIPQKELFTLEKMINKVIPIVSSALEDMHKIVDHLLIQGN